MRPLVLCLFAALGPGCADGETVRRLTLVATGDPVSVAATPASGAAGIALGRLTGGDELALVWSDAVDDGTNEHIVARRFDENLNAIGAQVELREPTSNLLRPVTVCGEADVGRNAFVAAWGEKVSLLNLADGVTLDLGNVRAARVSGEPPAAQAVFEVRRHDRIAV